MSGSIKKLTSIFFASKGFTNSIALSSCPSTSKPPSVVNSCLFSGTRQTACGLIRSAISCISSVIAISKFRRVLGSILIASTSASLICRLSSLRCVVIEATPHSLQILAAVSTSGSIPPLAFLNVAI